MYSCIFRIQYFAYVALYAHCIFFIFYFVLLDATFDENNIYSHFIFFFVTPSHFSIINISIGCFLYSSNNFSSL